MITIKSLFNCLWCSIFLLGSLPQNALVAAGREKATIEIEQMTPGVSYRQNVCDQYEAFRNGTVELKDSLKGMSLNVLMSAYEDGYFNYDFEEGINPDNPGLTAVLMDELARRGSFTWRDSFGISVAPYGNHSWTDLLVWGAEVYDINIDWWAQNVDRMNMGVAFLEEWYDSSIILIRKKPVETVSNDIIFFNWLRPYDTRVWLLTVFTIVLSGLVYQWIEHVAGERGDRTMWEWWLENWYLSALNFTQTYEYEPKTVEGRLFGVSMAIWALVMTATYTANLASLLVDKSTPALIVTSIEEAVIAGVPICTFQGTNSDTFIKLNMPTAIRVEKKTLEEVYDGLHKGECLLAAEVVASWEELKAIRKYNPTCDLERISATVWPNKAGFATKADAGNLCSGLIRDVINLHMSEMIADGFLEDAWEREHRLSLDIDCDAYRPDLDAGGFTDSPTSAPGDGERRLLQSTVPADNQYTQQYDTNRLRRLKAGKGAAGGAVAAAAAAGGGNDGDASELTLEQMIGSFAFHWFIMFISLCIGHFKRYYGMYGKKQVKGVKKALSRSLSTLRSQRFSKSSKFDKTSRQNTARTDINTSDSSNLNSIVPHNDDLKPSMDLDANARTTKVCFDGNFDGDIELNDKTADNEDKDTNVQNELHALRESQKFMEQNQSQMLVEQRMLKEQIQLLVSLVNRQQQPHDSNGSTRLVES